MTLKNALCLVVALACASGALAQVGTSTITGRVSDMTGAVVPNVAVTVVNAQTSFQFKTVTNQEGIFRVQSLQPGPYRVVFEASGFKRLVRESVELRTGDTLPVNAVLEVGSVAESVEVTAAAPLLETETSATGTVVAGKLIYDLPLYQRYVNSTFHLVPGVQTGGYAYGGSLGSYHVAGQRSGAIGFFEDGVAANDTEGGTEMPKPVQNSVAEVKALTTVVPAEYGHSAGGVISVVKKTGTNQIHGLASAYGRSRRMQHRRFFDLYKASQPQPNNPNGTPNWFILPDASVGGPVVIPKLYDGRNKTFFFFGYQKLIEKKALQTYTNVPTPDMRSGDFSFGGIGNPLFDPSTTRQVDGQWVRDPFPGNRVPVSRFDPVARKVLEIDPWHAPNSPGTYNASGPVDNYFYAEPSRTFFEDYNGRIDHQFSEAFKIYGSYTYNHQSGWGRPRNIRVPDFDAVEGNLQPFTGQNWSAGATYILSPTLINDARAGYYRRRNDRIVPSFGKNYAQILGIPNIAPDLLPAFGSGNDYGSPESTYGIAVTGPSRHIGETLSFRNDLTKIHGTHAFKMGYEVLRHRFNSTVKNYPSGQFLFDGMTAGLQPDGNAVPRTGNTFAGFLLGWVRQAQFDAELASWLPRSYIHSFYFQDDWKVTPNLTLNLGLRYTNESPYSTKYGQMTNFFPAATDDITGRMGAFIHPEGGLNARDNNNFQPRIGVAWHPLRKWVFRGGFGFYTVDVKFPLRRGNFEEYVAQANQQRAPGDPRPLYQISRGPDPQAFRIRPNGTSGYIGTNFGSRSAEWWDPSLRNPYVMNWNASIQYEPGMNYLVELTYQGSAGVGLIERWQANAFPVDLGRGDPALQAAAFRAPQNFRSYTHFGDVRFRSNMGHSTFHSGTVKVEKRYSQGLTFLSFYTFSKAINSQDDNNAGGGVAPLQNRALEKARAGYDRNHRVVGTVSYELPMGRGKKWFNGGGVVNWLLGGYEIAWIQTFETGNPLTFSFRNSPYNYFPTWVGDWRPDLAGSPELRDNWRDMGPARFNQQTINPLFDINDFAYPAPFTPGNAGRNIVTGTPLVWSQVSAKKNFYLSERFRFQVRWDFQNALKTYNFETPTTAVDFQNPRTFAKTTSDPRTASFGGQPLMNLTLQLTW
ncbi:MAG: TonB-dependent receptor [Bryobacterales bacterium]|nr:TonB-dependent receptor [Bryobacterales bacterium]